MNTPKIKAIFALLCVMALMAFPGEVFGKALAVSPQTITPPAGPVPDGNDFATLVLHDPWDMSQFTDISQFLNNSGQVDLVRKISVANGLFKGTSSPRADAQFYPLIAGYPSALLPGKVGHNYPISKSTYKCMYIAMQVNSVAPRDMFQVFWFANQKYSNKGGTYGSTKGIFLYPEAGAKMPSSNSMRLYSVNLSTTTTYNTPWNNMPAVQSIRIDPTLQANVAFAVDWVRLTDCNAVKAHLTWTGGKASETAIWLQPVGTTRNIRVAADVDGSSGSYDLDTQGIAPGSYNVGLGTATTCCSQMDTSSPLVINQTAVASFTRPSFSSGPGKSWDFSTSNDVTSMKGIASSVFANGRLNMVTNSGPRPGGTDSRIFLRTAPFSTTAYRYLTFRMSSTNGSAPWQNPVYGMIARLIWGIKGPTYALCYLTTNGIPYDIGYQTYSIDLDSNDGTAVTRLGGCAGVPAKTWKASGTILTLRFDPNEDVTCIASNLFVRKTCGHYVQKLDYLRLTAIDQAVIGSVFPIQIRLNRFPNTLTSLAFYYTTDRTKPTQNPAVGTLQTTPTSLNVTYQWDTTGVAAGTYYVCAHIEDGFNPVTYCSEAAVIAAP